MTDAEKFTVKCPACEQSYEVSVRLQDHVGATVDCKLCGELLLIHEGTGLGARLTKFHEHLHERDGRWPADGKGTGFVEVSDYPPTAAKIMRALNQSDTGLNLWLDTGLLSVAAGQRIAACRAQWEHGDINSVECEAKISRILLEPLNVTCAD
jgi:ribosomal protein S27E